MKKPSLNRILSATLASLFMLPPNIASAVGTFQMYKNAQGQMDEWDQDEQADWNAQHPGQVQQANHTHRVLSPFVLVEIPKQSSFSEGVATPGQGIQILTSPGATTVTRTSGFGAGGVMGLTNTELALLVVPAIGRHISRTFVGVPAAGQHTDLSAAIPEKLSDLKNGEQVTKVKTHGVTGVIGGIAGIVGAGLEPMKVGQDSTTVSRTHTGRIITTTVIASHKGMPVVGGLLLVAGKDSKIESSFTAQVLSLPDNEVGQALYKKLIEEPESITAIIAAGLPAGVKILNTESGEMMTHTDAIGMGIPFVADRNANESVRLIHKIVNTGSKKMDVYGFEATKGAESNLIDMETGMNVAMVGSIAAPLDADSDDKKVSVVNGEFSMSYSTNHGDLGEYRKSIKRMATWAGVSALMGLISKDEKDSKEMGSFNSRLGIKIPQASLASAMARASSKNMNVEKLQTFIKEQSFITAGCMNTPHKPICEKFNTENPFPYGESLSALNVMLTSLEIMHANQDQADESSRKAFNQAYSKFGKAMILNSVAFKTGMKLLGASKVEVEFETKGTHINQTHTEAIVSAEDLDSVVLLAEAKDNDDQNTEVKVTTEGTGIDHTQIEQLGIGILGK